MIRSNRGIQMACFVCMICATMCRGANLELAQDSLILEESIAKRACFVCTGTSTACRGTWEVKKINPELAQSTWMLEARIGVLSDETKPILVFNSDALGGIITLSSSGNYQLAEDLNYTVSITASKVALNLQQHKINISDLNTSAIMINGVTQVVVGNGYLQGASVTGGAGSGIRVTAGASVLNFKDLTITGFGNGVSLVGSSTSNAVTSCTMNHVQFVANDIGLSASYVSSSIIKSCNALYSAITGFSLVNSDANCLYDCAALKTGSDTGALGSAIGFKSMGGTSNLFNRCVAKQTKSSSTTFGAMACGFLFTGTEAKSKIVDCIVNETDVVSTPTAWTCGINLLPVFNGGLSQIGSAVTVSANNVLGVRWSPDSKYLASIDATTARIFGFDGTTLSQILTVAPGAVALSNIAWSPDGKYLAFGELAAGAGTIIYLYTFNGTTVTGPVTVSLGANNRPGALEWSPNGKFLAVAAWNQAGAQTYAATYSFDGTSLVGTATSVPIGYAPGQAISWSPDGQYVVITGGSNTINVYKFATNTTLTFVTSSSTNLTNTLRAVWSPNGRYIAVGDLTGKVSLFIFDGTNLTYVTQTAVIGGANYTYALTWSPCGCYLVAGSITSTFPLRVFNFNGTALTQVGADQLGTAAIYALSWSPDGKYIASGEAASVSSRIKVYSAMYGPSNCFIDNCDVCDTFASGQTMGNGILGAGTNVFTRNKAGNNAENYGYGIPNVYDGRFDISRSVVQPFDNISMPTTL